jgi:hypothetical protein
MNRYNRRVRLSTLRRHLKIMGMDTWRHSNEQMAPAYHDFYVMLRGTRFNAIHRVKVAAEIELGATSTWFR